MLDSLPDAEKPFRAYKADASRSAVGVAVVCSRQARRARSVLNVREEHEHFRDKMTSKPLKQNPKKPAKAG